MAIEKETKKKVAQEWQNALPQLAPYSQNALYKIAGCIVLGIELTKLPRSEDYRPHFVIYPLWRKDVKECLDTPILLKEFYNKKRLQFAIPYEKHDLYSKEALEGIRAQVPFLFDLDLSVKKVITFLDEYSKMPPLSAAPTSYLQGKLQEAKLQIGLYKGSSDAEGIIGQMRKVNWDAENFRYFGVDLPNWLKGLDEKISNREMFLKQIELNKQDSKLLSLPQSELKL